MASSADYRLNSFPFVHSGLPQALTSVVALVPLLERFEAEHGTLVSVALFIGRMFSLRGVAFMIQLADITNSFCDISRYPLYPLRSCPLQEQ